MEAPDHQNSGNRCIRPVKQQILRGAAAIRQMGAGDKDQRAYHSDQNARSHDKGRVEGLFGRLGYHWRYSRGHKVDNVQAEAYKLFHRMPSLKRLQNLTIPEQRDALDGNQRHSAAVY